MSRDRGRSLNMEDRILWSRVAGSVTPLPGRSVPSIAKAPPRSDESKPSVTAPTVSAKHAAPKPPSQPPVPAGLDRLTRRKLAKGRLPIEGKVDLHGLNQREAHGLLLSFLHRAQADGRRHVLIVTGKGSSTGGDGVLRRAVPQWLATPTFRAFVSGFEDANRIHGGHGAIYVRMRRRPGAAE